MSKSVVMRDAEKCMCNLTLAEIGFDSKKLPFLENTGEISATTYKALVLCSPSTRSNLGKKISKKFTRHIDEVVKELAKELDVKNTYFYSTYCSKKANCKDLSIDVTQDSGTFLCLYCPGGFMESLYASIRDALAHGNIMKTGNKYILYSVSPASGSEKDPFRQPLKFLLKINKLTKLRAFISVFQKYN